jgi:sortase A
MRRIIKWFIEPALLMLASIAFVALAYRSLLTQPASTIAIGAEAGQRANLKASRPVSDARRGEIAEADLRTLLAANARTAALVREAGVGRVAVPSVDISLPVFNQINDATLSVGTVMYYPERGLGRGNTVLASHHYLRGSGLLNALDRVKKGDAIELSDLDTVWTYRVASNQVVKKDQVQVLQDTADTRVTLIRCEGPRGTPYRRVVTGLLYSRSGIAVPQAKALGITATREGPTRRTPLTVGAAAISRTIRFRRLDGWLWLLVAGNVLVLVGCATGYVLGGSRKH